MPLVSCLTYLSLVFLHFRLLLMPRCSPRGRGKSSTSIFGRDKCTSNSRCSSELWWWEDKGWIWPQAWWLLVVYQQPWAIPGFPRPMLSSFHFLRTTVLNLSPPPLLGPFSPKPPSPGSQLLSHSSLHCSQMNLTNQRIIRNLRGQLEPSRSPQVQHSAMQSLCPGHSFSLGAGLNLRMTS